ncbi:MAG: hypothetical protein IPH77_19725 [Ignavibacteria bacterium]|nr:hypothetical protein [Ignavibacteria bacterium]
MGRLKEFKLKNYEDLRHKIKNPYFRLNFKKVKMFLLGPEMRSTVEEVMGYKLRQLRRNTVTEAGIGGSGMPVKKYFMARK